VTPYISILTIIYEYSFIHMCDINNGSYSVRVTPPFWYALFRGGGVCSTQRVGTQYVEILLYRKQTSFFIPLPFEEWWSVIKCYPYPCVRTCVRASVRYQNFGFRSITFKRLHRFISNLVCCYKTSKHRSSSIWVTIH